MDVRKAIRENADEKYRAFSEKLLPGVKGIAGVRLPVLRKTAREIAKGDWRSFLEKNAGASFEETMLRGMVIGCADMRTEERLERTKAFLPEIDNWSVCDSFCAGLKATKEEPAAFLPLIDEALADERCFFRRFALVTLLTYYTAPEQIEGALERIRRAKGDEYYAMMAAAWAICACYFADREKTARVLETGVADEGVREAAVRKICQSRLATAADRAFVRRLPGRSAR